MRVLMQRGAMTPMEGGGVRVSEGLGAVRPD
jgi:hypothetical protein